MTLDKMAAQNMKKGDESAWLNLSMKGSFPDVVLLKIFSNLSIHDLGRSCLVCKQWNSVIHSDILWKRFVPKWPWFEPPPEANGAYQIVSKLWRKMCVKIGNERWHPNPMPELVKYEKRLRKAEYHQYYMRCSKMMLMARMNPRYEFTTKGKDSKDQTINEICEVIWNGFGGKDNNPLKIDSYQEVMRRAEFKSRKQALTKILNILEPRWYLKALELAPYQLDEKGEIIEDRKGNREEFILHQEEDDIEENITVSPDSSIFGSYGDKSAWKTKINKRLPIDLYRKIKAFFADGSESFIEYFLSDGCWNENYEYAYSLLISDTAVFHIKQFYEV